MARGWHEGAGAGEEAGFRDGNRGTNTKIEENKKKIKGNNVLVILHETFPLK